MACILVQFDPPRDPKSFEEYAHWFLEDGARLIRATEGLSDLHVFRNVTGQSPVVTAIAYFPEMRGALAAARSSLWSEMVSGLSRWGCDNLQVTLLEPSPILPGMGQPK